MQLAVLGIVGENSHLGVVPDYIFRNMTAECALHRDFYAGMQAAEFPEYRQQAKGGELVGSDGKLPHVQLAKLDKSGFRVAAQVQQLLGVFLQHPPRVRKHAVARRTVEQGLSNVFLKLVDRLAHRGLRAVKLLSGAGKTALAGDCEKDFELSQIHIPSPAEILLGSLPQLILFSITYERWRIISCAYQSCLRSI